MINFICRHRALCQTLLLLPCLTLLQACSDTCNGHLKYGQPSDADQLLCRQGYALGYDFHYRNPAWIASHVTAESIADKTKQHKVRHDKEISRELRLEYRDYRGSPFTPGRLHTSNGGGPEGYEETFLLSNSAPQYVATQRRLWPSVERHEEQLVARHGEAYIVTGPVYAGINRTLGRTGQGVPSHFYKVYYLPEPQRMYALLLPNTPSPGNRPIEEYVKSVKEIEAYTGFNFFHKLLNVDEERMKDTDALVE